MRQWESIQIEFGVNTECMAINKRNQLSEKNTDWFSGWNSLSVSVRERERKRGKTWVLSRKKLMTAYWISNYIEFEVNESIKNECFENSVIYLNISKNLNFTNKNLTFLQCLANKLLHYLLALVFHLRLKYFRESC